MNNICCVYIIISPSSKIYIGQTNNFRRRMNSYKNSHKIKHQKRLVRSLEKYGFENHKADILIKCERSQLDFWEIFYIKLFSSFNSDHGLNSTSGGNTPKRELGIKKSQEWKDKISQAHLGKKRPKFSKEWIDNMTKSHKGLVKSESHLKNLKAAAEKRKKEGGYVFSEEQIRKSSKALKEYFKTKEGIEQVKRNVGKSKKVTSIPIERYSLENVFIDRWESTRSAYQVLKIFHSNISACLHNRQKTAGGFIWKYAEPKLAA